MTGLSDVNEDLGTVTPNSSTGILELKDENKLLRESIKKMNARLGDEIISDDDSIDSLENFEIEINTRHYEYDNQLTGGYWFITNVCCRPFILINKTILITFLIFYLFLFQSRGDRLYLKDSLKIKLEAIQLLKRMNVNYPQNHEDFDEMFLFQAMRALFTEADIKLCAESKSLKSIYGMKYLLYKGILAIQIFTTFR